MKTGQTNAFSVKTMFVMVVATGIDALAVGITFSLHPDVPQLCLSV